ncbi:coiled-coil domain-containing protein 196 [Urocitellus parryii]
MTSGANSSGSYLSSKRSSKIDDNYLKELNEDLKLRKQELLDMLKPLENKNNLLLQKLMSNLEEKQKSLQIMRQIMAGKGCDESSVMDLIKEAEEMKQNLERKNKMLRKEMELLWNKSELETSFAEKVKEIRKEKQQRKMEWVKYQEQANTLQNDFHGKVIELRIEALKNYQKANELKLSLYLQQNFAPKQTFLNLPGFQGSKGTTTMGRATTGRNELNVRILGSKTYNAQQGAKGNQSDDAGGRLLFLRSLPKEALKD